MIAMLDDCFDAASLETFMAELVASGFEPVPDTNGRLWRGPIHSSFQSLTEAETIDIAIVPGWPFQPPAVFVQGLSSNHSTVEGLVCMWREGDDSFRWTSFNGLTSRIEEWCGQAEHGWRDDDLGRDALLNFQDQSGTLAIFDLTEIGVSRGSMGDFHGVVASRGTPVALVPGHAQAGQLRGLWFRLGELRSPPPRRFSEVPTHLTRSQRRQLSAQIDRRLKSDPLVASGGVDLVMVCWTRDGRPDLLVLAVERLGEDVRAKALQLGPHDKGTLMLRAGPDAQRLEGCRAVVFGAGALGGNVALALAASGVGILDLVDGDVLTPGNVVRHVAGYWAAGWPKVAAVSTIVEQHARWTKTNTFVEWPRTPSEIRKRISPAHIVVDATGDGAFTGSVAAIALEDHRPLVSGALYRGGSIGRVRRIACDADTPIVLRAESSRYPVIPPGDHFADSAFPEIGCSAPVNNAPPTVVLSCSALIAEVAIDFLTQRCSFGDEVIYVYRSGEVASPFDRLGRLEPSIQQEETSRPVHAHGS